MRKDASSSKVNNGTSTDEQLFFNYQDYFKDDLSIALNSLERLSANIFFDLATLMRIRKDKLAEDIFDISPKTISRYRSQEKKLNPRDSETALKLMALYHKGKEIFGNVDSFNNWLHKPAFGLGGREPYQLMGTLTGIDLIFDELVRIEFGDLA